MGNSACYNNNIDNTIVYDHDMHESYNHDQTNKCICKQAYKNTPPTSQDEFIIKLHNHQQKYGIINNISQQQILSDQRRVVFVSLLGLYQTYFLCPAPVLYSAIFILPIKREWIYSPEQYKHELNKNILKRLTLFQNQTDWNNFQLLLKWKDSQNLVIWAEDEKFSDDGELVSEFWINLSNKLTRLYDPITKSTYNPILFDRKWWQFNYDISKSKYKTRRFKILAELFFSTKQFKPMMEIINQSNPSLNPIVSYQLPQYKQQVDIQSKRLPCLKNTSVISLDESKKNRFVNTYENQMDNDGFVSLNNETLCADLIKEEGDKPDDLDVENEGEWVISMDYNEYDIITIV